MSTPATIAELIVWVAAAHQRFQQAIVRLSDAELQEPWLPGGWSAKDVLAHLAWWDRWLVYTLQADGADPARPGPPLLDRIPPGHGWADQLNALVFELNRDRPLGEIQAEFELARRRVVQALHDLTPQDVFGTGERSAAIGQAIGPLVFGIYEHYDEHSLELEALFQT